MTAPEGEVEGPLDPVPGGQPEGEPQPWMPMPGTYGSRNAGRRQSILESFGQVVTRPILKDALEAADSEFQLALAAGRALVDEAQQHADDALGAVANAGSIMDTIQGTGADVVAKHTEVLTLHGQAITAASNAAGDAALAAAKALEASDHAADALILFEAQQQQIDAEQNARLDLHEQMIDLMRSAQGSGLVATSGTTVATGTNGKVGPHVTISSGSTSSTTATGNWVGKLILQASWAGADWEAIRMQEFDIPMPGNVRTVATSNVSGSRVWVRADYEIYPGVQEFRDLTGGSLPVAQESWTTVSTHTWTVPAGASRPAIMFRVGWDAVPFLPTYRMRILVNGVEAKISGKFNWGPLIGNGYRTNSISHDGVTAGSTVTFQVWTNAANANERVVRNTETRISWIEG